MPRERTDTVATWRRLSSNMRRIVFPLVPTCAVFDHLHHLAMSLCCTTSLPALLETPPHSQERYALHHESGYTSGNADIGVQATGKGKKSASASSRLPTSGITFHLYQNKLL